MGALPPKRATESEHLKINHISVRTLGSKNLPRIEGGPCRDELSFSGEKGMGVLLHSEAARRR